MALFDVIDDIAKKQILKTETGDNRIFGVVIGKVVNNYDEEMPGRVCVMVPVRNAKGTSEEEAGQLKWARVAMLSSGKEWGHYFLPEVGDQVLLAFEQGNIEKPYVIGCLPLDKDQFLKKAADERNQYKKIVTRHGSSIIFEDHFKKEGEEGEEGDQDKITIHTARSSHQIVLNNENNTILISDKDGKNKIRIKTEEEKGAMEIEAEKKLTIKVGEIELIMNGQSGAGTTVFKTGKFEVNAQDNMLLSAENGTVNIKGTNVKLAASAGMNVQSDGMTKISGATVSVG